MGIWLGDFSCKTWLLDQIPSDIARRFFKRTKHSIVNHRARNIYVHTPAYIRLHMEHMHTNQKSGSSWCVMYVHIYIYILCISHDLFYSCHHFILLYHFPPVTFTTPNFATKAPKVRSLRVTKGVPWLQALDIGRSTSQLVSAWRPRMCPPLSALEATILASTRLQVTLLPKLGHEIIT